MIDIDPVMSNALNLQEINQEQALDLCKFNIQTGNNIFLFGRRGVGKSFICMDAAKQQKYKVNYLNLSLMDKSDMLGYPDMHNDSDVVVFKSPHYLPALKSGEKIDTVLLFDEVDKAAPEVTAPLLEILQFRTVNGKPINAASCILTGNLPNEGAYANQISTALLDRGSKYVLQFDFNKWMEWAKENGVHDLVTGFLRSNTDLACGKDNDVSYASPSPRSWTLASEALIKARKLKIVDIDTITNIISGYVGVQAGVKFKSWYEHYRRFEPYIISLISGGELGFNFESLHPTEKLVFVISCCHFAKIKVLEEKNKATKFSYLENLCRFLLFFKIEKEMQVLAMYNSFDFDIITKHKLYECKVFFDLFNELNSNVVIRK